MWGEIGVEFARDRRWPTICPAEAAANAIALVEADWGISRVIATPNPKLIPPTTSPASAFD